LIVLKRDLELLAPEAGERQRNAQGITSCCTAVYASSRNPFDVVRGITSKPNNSGLDSKETRDMGPPQSGQNP
jgi:hypothetical protein